MRLLFHGVACAILLILSYKIGQLRQIRADNEQVETLIQSGLLESLPIHQEMSSWTLVEFEKQVKAYNAPSMQRYFSQLVDQKHQIDSLVFVIDSCQNDLNMLTESYDSLFQVHARINTLCEKMSVDCRFDQFYPVFSSDQIQWQTGQPVTLQLRLGLSDPHKYFQEVPISINHHPVKNNEYQQQFNTSGTHPLHIRYQHPKTLDSVTLTYFVNVQ